MFHANFPVIEGKVVASSTKPTAKTEWIFFNKLAFTLIRLTFKNVTHNIFCIVESVNQHQKRRRRK